VRGRVSREKNKSDVLTGQHDNGDRDSQMYSKRAHQEKKNRVARSIEKLGIETGREGGPMKNDPGDETKWHGR
jgi:hypothetical protein